MWRKIKYTLTLIGGVILGLLPSLWRIFQKRKERETYTPPAPTTVGEKYKEILEKQGIHLSEELTKEEEYEENSTELDNAHINKFDNPTGIISLTPTGGSGD